MPSPLTPRIPAPLTLVVRGVVLGLGHGRTCGRNTHGSAGPGWLPQRTLPAPSPDYGPAPTAPGRPLRPAQPGPARGWAWMVRMGTDGAGAALTRAALAATAGPEEREHRGVCRESGPGRNPASCSSARRCPRCFPAPLFFARSAPAPSGPRLPRPPLPPREGPAAARPATPATWRSRSFGDAVPSQTQSPHKHGPHQHGPPTNVSADHGLCLPGRGSREPRPCLRPSVPRNPRVYLHRARAAQSRTGNAPQGGSIQCSSSLFIRSTGGSNSSVCFLTIDSSGCATSVTPKPPCPAKMWHGAGVCAVFWPCWEVKVSLLQRLQTEI